MTVHRLDLNVASDFTTTPGPRKRLEGEFSGEQFLQENLRPRFLEALSTESILLVNLDGAAGYPTSFLEEAFGGLAREFGPDKVNAALELRCNDEPYLAEDIHRYINEAKIRP